MNNLKDIHMDYLTKRWNKISVAVYTVVSHIKDSDQIKWNIRNRALDTMSFMSEISNAFDGQRQILIDSCLKEIHIILSELALATHVGLINRANQSILSDEIQKFIVDLIEFRDKDAVLSPLQKEFMQVEAPAVALKDKVEGSMSLISQSKGQNIKDATADNLRDKRRASIIELLKKNASLGIKDFVIAIKGCSAKTIQRELTNLVDEGVLYRVGERRWSTYSLARSK